MPNLGKIFLRPGVQSLGSNKQKDGGVILPGYRVLVVPFDMQGVE